MKIDKISFLSADEKDVGGLLLGISQGEREEALSIIEYYLSYGSDFSFAFALFDGALLVRCFDGAEYFFAFPHSLREGADIGAAIEKCVRYAVFEEIEPVFAGVPADEAALFFSLGFRHINADSESPESDTYRVTLKNECSLVSEYPEASNKVVSLSRLTGEDEADYARLCRDENNNKYWGYDFREDYEGCSDAFLLELAERDFLSSSALSFAIRTKNCFLGEALLSNFDFKGGADISIRILPEHQKKGYASSTLSLLFEIAESIGLTALYAGVDAENVPSLALFSKNADERSDKDGIVIFKYYL